MREKAVTKKMSGTSGLILFIGLMISLLTILWTHNAAAADAKRDASETRTLHKTVNIDGVEIFYREAGPADAPTILLLHGFPTSSHMFRNLIPALSDSFHLIAPDYPGFGNSAQPPMDAFDYTFDNLARVSKV